MTTPINTPIPADTRQLCGCGRSPNGYCLGWHSLTEEEYQQKLEAWLGTTFNKEQPQ